MKMRKFKKGFTLVELVVVIAVIAVLAAVSVGAYFGVTDSANSSAAEQYKKQIKDLWIMFSVSSDYQNGSTDEILTANAEYFCTTYSRENGPGQVSLNYKLVNLVEIDENVSNQQSSIITTTGIMFLLKSDYSTYLVVENDRITYESDLLKSEDNFKRIMKEEGKVDYLSTDDKDLFYTLGYSAFELSNFGDSENPVYGYQYYKVNITGDCENDVVDVRTNSTLAKTKSIYAPAEAKLHDGGVYGKTFKLINKGVEFDSNQLFNTDNSEINVYEEPVLIHEGDNKYYIGEINISYEALLKDLKINLYNYPICDLTYNGANGSTAIYFNDFSAVNSYINQDEIKNDGKVHYLFVGNAILDTKLTVPSNYNLVQDFDVSIDSQTSTTENIKSMTKFGSYNYHKNFSEIYKSNDGNEYFFWDKTDRHDNSRCAKNSGNDLTSGTLYVPKRELNSNVFKISETGSIDLYGKIFNEAFVYLASGGDDGINTTNACTMILEEGASINLYENSVFRALGNIEGNGFINAYKNSNVIELFRITSFMGGKRTSSFANSKVFPFYDYHIDVISAPLNLFFGSKYSCIIGFEITANIGARGSYVYTSTNIGMVGDTNSLFKIQDDKSCITKKYVRDDTSLYGKTVLHINGNVIDNPLSISVNIGVLAANITMKTTEMNFPLTNIELVIENRSCLTLGTSENNKTPKYEIYPTSKIVNKGTMKLINGIKPVLLNNKTFDSSVYNDNWPWAKGLFEIFNHYNSNNILYNNGLIEGELLAASNPVDDQNLSFASNYYTWNIINSNDPIYYINIANKLISESIMSAEIGYHSIPCYKIELIDLR